MTAAIQAGLARLNELPGREAREALHACCAAAAWLDDLVAGRPYPDRSALLDRSAAVLANLDWADIREALDAHPRIGERARQAGREAAWSAAEQSGMDSATAEVRAALVEANRAYEDRFGHVFLIFATGRTDIEMLAAARERLGNDEATEREIVRIELGKIVELRLTKAAGGGMSLSTHVLDTGARRAGPGRSGPAGAGARRRVGRAGRGGHRCGRPAARLDPGRRVARRDVSTHLRHRRAVGVLSRGVGGVLRVRAAAAPPRATAARARTATRPTGGADGARSQQLRQVRGTTGTAATGPRAACTT